MTELLKNKVFIIDTRKDGKIRLINPRAIIKGVEDTGEFLQLEYEKKAFYQEDVILAVKRLKNEIEPIWRDFNADIGVYTKTIEKINETFEDVTKNEAKKILKQNPTS